MGEIPAGTKAESLHLVTAELVTNHLRTDAARVLATPLLIGLLEQTARRAVLPFLSEQEDTVGTEVHIRHLAAAPLGMHIRLLAEVTRATARRVYFRLEACDEAGCIAEGTHERALISIPRFAVRAEQRLARRSN